MTTIDASWSAYGNTDDEMKQFLSQHETLPHFADLEDTEAANKLLFKMISHYCDSPPVPTDLTDVDKIQMTIPVRDGANIRALLYRPANVPQSGSPLALMFHGGGYSHPFPVPIQDCIDALRWCATNAVSLCADPSKGFLIGGESAGGGIAAILSHIARDEDFPCPLTGVYLKIPLLLDPAADPESYMGPHSSYTQSNDESWPVLTGHDVQFFSRLYGAESEDPLASPMLWTSGHKGLPRTYMQISGMDPLRDQDLVYATTLEEAGVDVRVDVYSGVPHGFDAVFPMIEKARKCKRDREAGFQWLMRSEKATRAFS